MTSWKAYEQIDRDVAHGTIANIVAARYSGDAVLNGEMERRGISIGWNANLTWLLDRTSLPTDMIPAQPWASAPTTGQVWPRGAGQA